MDTKVQRNIMDNKLQLFCLAYDCNYGPMHMGNWAFGKNINDAIDNYRIKFPNREDYPNTDGYAEWTDYPKEKIFKDLGIAFNIDENKLYKKYGQIN